jgi:diphosphomevalonate decarboxylase
MYGGFVRWTMGVLPDGSDSIASEVAPASHWPEMEILILVVNASKKATSSTTGMQATVDTSALIKVVIVVVVVVASGCRLTLSCG